MKIRHINNTHSIFAASGFASTLMVISMGIGLLIMLAYMYRDTINNQDAQKNNMLSNDYQQREDAFLRALVSIVPNMAMRSMTQDSLDAEDSLNWNEALTTALTRANVQQDLPDDIRTTLGIIEAMKKANTANSSGKVNRNEVVFPVNDEHINPRASHHVSSGLAAYNPNISTFYPPRLTMTNSQDLTGIYPLISLNKTYDTATDGWTSAVSPDRSFARIPLPKNHFKYKDGDEFIARHNWWTFNLNFAAKDQALTNLRRSQKQYLFSIYEVPAQLAINAGSNAILGSHENSDNWGANIDVAGGVFASSVQTTGGFASTSISSRANITLEDAAAVGNTSIADGNQYELLESQAQKILTTSAGDSGRIAFIPINGGEFITTGRVDQDAAFFDNPDLTINTPDPFSDPTGNNASLNNSISPTIWNDYSRGANQCKMRIVYDDDTYFFSFQDGIDTNTTEALEILDAADDDVRPQFNGIFEHNGDRFTVNMDALLALLGNNGISPNISNSLYIKYVGTSPDANVILDNAEDLTPATFGFSLVTNSRLIIASDTNIVAPPIGFSSFAPSTQFGNSNYANTINVTGQISSTKKGGASYIADLKAGDDDVTPANLNATLDSIIDPAQLPPINMMNWMVVIREITVP